MALLITFGKHYQATLEVHGTIPVSLFGALLPVFRH